MDSSEQTPTPPGVNRPFAAEILNVSLRTLDRYAKRKVISSVRRGRELYFQEKDLLEFKAKLLARQEWQEIQAHKKAKNDTIVDRPTAAGRGGDFPGVARAQVREQGWNGTEEALVMRDAGNIVKEESPFKKLYEKGEEELKMTRNKLQVANYRIGSLEAQVQSMVPMIEFKRQNHELLSLAENNREKQQGITILEQQVKIEQFVKKVYAVFLFFMMILVPVLIMLRFVG